MGDQHCRPNVLSTDTASMHSLLRSHTFSFICSEDNPASSSTFTSNIFVTKPSELVVMAARFTSSGRSLKASRMSDSSPRRSDMVTCEVCELGISHVIQVFILTYFGDNLENDKWLFVSKENTISLTFTTSFWYLQHSYSEKAPDV